METVKLILYCFAGVGFWTVSASIALWFRDRSGSSGRSDPWQSNPRIISRAEELAALSDEEHQAYGAMVMAMKPRDDRRDEPNGL